MATQITDYKCPACTGPLRFDGATGKLVCDYCGNAYEVAEIEAQYAKQEAAAEETFNADAAKAEKAQQQKDENAAWDTSGLQDNWGADANGLRVMNCPSCGAELITDETTASTSCPYCGNNTIVPGQFGGKGTLKPDYVLPFKLDKEAAKQALKAHYKGKIFLPKAFTSANHIEELKGIYVPFWLFDATADADCHYHATRTMSHRERDENVVVTQHFEIQRSGTMEFEGVPVDASSKMPDDYMDSVEPYDYSELKAFSTAYLPGYLADKYDVTAKESMPRADARCKQSAVDVLRRDVIGYQTVNLTGSNVRLRRGKVNYALMPVWSLRTKWQGKDYLFMMNGQTGKLVGDLPVDRAKFWGLFGILALAFGVLFGVSGFGTALASMILL